MKTLLAAFAAIFLLAATAAAQQPAYPLTPGLLPGVWKGLVPAGPSITVNSCQPYTVQPMARMRIRIGRPWWRCMPPVIRYCPSGQACPQPQAPACQGPGCNRWGEFEGRWGFGQPPTAAPTE